MTQEKRRLWSQIIFPSMVLLAVAAALVAPAFLQKKTFTAVKLDEPGAASANWANVSEQEFFELMSVAVRLRWFPGLNTTTFRNRGRTIHFRRTFMSFGSETL